MCLFAPVAAGFSPVKIVISLKIEPKFFFNLKLGNLPPGSCIQHSSIKTTIWWSISFSGSSELKIHFMLSVKNHANWRVGWKVDAYEWIRTVIIIMVVGHGLIGPWMIMSHLWAKLDGHQSNWTVNWLDGLVVARNTKANIQKICQFEGFWTIPFIHGRSVSFIVTVHFDAQFTLNHRPLQKRAIWKCILNQFYKFSRLMYFQIARLCFDSINLAGYAHESGRSIWKLI